MGFTIPNSPDATYADQAEPDAGDFRILSDGSTGSGVVAGCAVSAQGTPNMTVAVAAGTVAVAGVRATVASGNLTIGAADATNPRFDLITVNASGTKAVTAGTAAANAVFPSIPSGSVVLAAVYVPATITTIDSTRIIDKRVTVLLDQESWWMPTGAISETFRRSGARIELIGALSSGRLSLYGGAVIPGGATVSNISFMSGSTAAGTPTHQWFCLVDQSLNVLAKTVDDTSTAWAANTVKTLALSSPYTPTDPTPVYIGILVTATTVPTLAGVNTSVGGGTSAAVGIAPIIQGTSTTGLTTPASLGSTAGAITIGQLNAYAYLT